MTSADDRPVLTNRQGHPVHDDQNQRTVGSRDVAGLVMTRCVPDENTLS